MVENETIETKTKAGKQKKRTLPDSKNSDIISRTRPKRAATCTNYKEKSIRIFDKSATVRTKKDQQTVEDEIAALRLTSLRDNEPRRTRRLTDFRLHDSRGAPHTMEMFEIYEIFIDGVILPLDKCYNKEKEKRVRCQSFGPVKSWRISGFEDESPVIWISTELADYECVKPSLAYKKIYDHLFEKAFASTAVYKKLSKSWGGNPDMSLDELLAAVIRLMSSRKYFSNSAAIHGFVENQGEFVYNQLVGLDEKIKIQESRFIKIPVLAALRNVSSKLDETLRIGKVYEVEKDIKHAKLLRDEVYRKSIQQRRKSTRSSSSAASTKSYIKIREDDISGEYPLPAYYKKTQEETDEILLYDGAHKEELPCGILENWSLYNPDSRLISLELLPMKTCDDMDVNMFGSGLVSYDDGSGFCPDPESSPQGSPLKGLNGMPIFLSQIKEWMIEYEEGVFVITIRTDLAWYRLGKPSKQYAPWCEPVLKIARVATTIFTMLCEQTRIAKLSFAAVVRKLSEFQKNDKAYISSDPLAVERYLAVHGKVLLQLFSEHRNKDIQRCPFITGLASKLEDKHHTRWVIKKKKSFREEPNLNPMAVMAPVSRKDTMQATTTRLIRRIWGEFYSINAPDDSLQGTDKETVAEVVDEIEEEEDETEEPIEVQKYQALKKSQENSEQIEIRWDGEILGLTSYGEPLYRQALVGEVMVVVGGNVMLEVDNSSDLTSIYFVEYMFESLNHCKMLHGRLLQRGSETVLGSAANERELFLTNECKTVQLKDIKGTTKVEIRARPWGHQYRKDNNIADKLDHERAKKRKAKGLSVEYYCKSLYSPERGGFFSLPLSDIGLGNGFCQACKLREDKVEKSKIKFNVSKTSFLSNGVEYNMEDYVYVRPDHIYGPKMRADEKFNTGMNIGLRAYVVCQLLEIIAPMKLGKADPASFLIKVRRFYRPEDISSRKAYVSDIQELYYSQDTIILPPKALEGKCEVRKLNDMPVCREYPLSDHIFFCEYSYDFLNGSLKELPTNIKLKFSSNRDVMIQTKKKGKGIETETETDVKPNELPKEMCLATLDIFAGCGGLSHGLEKAGISTTKWAIEYEEPAGQAFRQNHPESKVFVNNCNVILRAIMEKCGDQDDCISTKEADELAAKLGENLKRDLPLPGQVDFISGGPPCQGFSQMNRHSKTLWSKVQCQMILAFLSFADYFRPRYFLLENVRNFVSHNKGRTFRLTLASLLEMGYQVRFGILEAGAYGLPQSRKRTIIWAAAPEEILPEWPEPMHVFGVSQLKISLPRGLHYAAVRSTKLGAPFRPITVRDTIGDLPPVENGESNINNQFQVGPVSWFQKEIRRSMTVLTDHICKEMKELNLIRCKNIPKSLGANWRDLPDETVKLSNGKLEKLIPTSLSEKSEIYDKWKGLFGRLDWEGNFPTCVTDPRPMGKVGNCFHPDQDRIVTVRECARSQGFPDSFIFEGEIQQRHKQIGNAVPPPLAFALGLKLKEAVNIKMSLQHQS